MHREQPFVIVICGATGVGKSTLSRRLASALGIAHILSGDLLRAALRATSADPASPIHFSSYSVPAADGSLPVDEASIIEGYERQTEQVVKASASAIRWGLSEGWALLAEGVHLGAGRLSQALADLDVPVLELTLHIEDEHVHSRRISDRAEKSARAKNLDRFACIRAIQQHLVELAHDAATPIIEVSDSDQALREAIWHVSQDLSHVFDRADHPAL